MTNFLTLLPLTIAFNLKTSKAKILSPHPTIIEAKTLSLSAQGSWPPRVHQMATAVHAQSGSLLNFLIYFVPIFLFGCCILVDVLGFGV